MPIELTDSNFENEIASGVTLVDFWAPWCGPCKMMAPIIDKLSKEFDGRAKIAKMNVDENSQTPSKFHIQGIPTMLFFKDGKPVDMVVGYTRQEEISQKLNNLL
ncbi:MAG: thioredoxin [Firmicutes bacterium]|nr:thioredoxin [Bacillota bacterium]MDD4263964.1 thioredoxin [Bacillota bacterium]MDD4693575.1 thioredoxin [Bacillota bacterium]